MARIDGHGIACDLPPGFEGEIYGLPLGPGETRARGVQTVAPSSEGADSATGRESSARSIAPATGAATTTSPSTTTSTTEVPTSTTEPSTTTSSPPTTTSSTTDPESQPGPVTVAPMTIAEPLTPPVLHVATFPLPPERGDYGNGAVDLMGTEDIFIALCEFDAEASRSALYAAEGFPRLTAADFDTSTLHRSFPNHSGCQKFFHVGIRSFCLYVVLGSHNFRNPLVRRVNEVVARIEIATG